MGGLVKKHVVGSHQATWIDVKIKMISYNFCVGSILRIVVGIMMFAIIPIGVAAGTNVNSCTTISSPGNYVLTNSIINNTATCIYITSSNVILDGAGYTIDGTNTASNYGVLVYKSSITLTNVTVKNLKVTDWNVGIYYYSSQNGRLDNNNASNNNFGISLSNSSNNTLSGNNANSNYDGIYLSSSNNNTLIGNNASSSNLNFGIYLDYSSNNTLSGNNASHNGHCGIYLDYSNNNTLSGNNASNNRIFGISLGYSSNNTLSGNNASSNNYYQDFGGGISLYYSSNNTLSGNIMTGNRNNLELFGRSDSDFDNQIDTSNLVDGKPVYYIKGAKDIIYDSYTNIGTFYCINCVNVTLKNFELKNNYNGIFFWNTSHSKIQNVTTFNNDYGIFLQSSSNNTLSGNNASNNLNFGIYLNYSSNNTLSDNIMTGNRNNLGLFGRSDSDFDNQIDTSNLVDGKPVYYIKGAKDIIYDSYTNIGTFYCINCVNVTLKNFELKNNYNGIFFWNTSHSKIQNVTTFNNDYGIFLQSSSNNTLSGNNASNNYYHLGGGISLSNSSNNTLSGNNASNNLNFGISLSNSSNNTLSGNNASNNTNFGIYLDYSSNNTLSGNNASSNNYDHYWLGGGISLSYSSNNTLSGNNANPNNVNGIYLYSSSNNMLSSNNANSNIYNNINLYLSSNNTLISNNANSNSYYGIYLYSSSNNTLSGNNANSNSYYGIYLGYSSNNTLSGNNASSNNVNGIYLYSSSDSKIYNNNFNNINNFYIYNSNINAWNTTKTPGTNIIGGPNLGGNFWAKPDGTGFSQTCADTNKDGICDVSYILNANNTDYLPLTIPAGYSYIYGKVMNNSIGIGGAVVTTNISNTTNADASGTYSLLVPAGTYNLTATSTPRFYTNSSITLNIVARTTVMKDIELLKKPTGNISGSVSK